MRFFRRLFYGKHKPICILTYHKVGNVLWQKVFKDICNELGWSFLAPYNSPEGEVKMIPRYCDVILVRNSLMDLEKVTDNFSGVHFVRDPRDVIVSGYLYHRRCEEQWCVNANFSEESPIVFPQVPYSQQHRTEEWKKSYLQSLGGETYQQNLLNRTQSEGLIFEMDHYAGWTIDSMKSWNYDDDRILEIKFESLMDSFDQTLKSMLDYCGISPSEIKKCARIASKHDLNQKTDEEIQNDQHITARNTTKWKEYFGEKEKKYFLQRFGDVLIQLGYEIDNQW